MTARVSNVSPAVAGDLTDVRPTASPEALARARAKFMLEAAPVQAFTPDVKPEVKRRAAKIVSQMGTPLDVARGMMAKRPPAEWEADLRAISPQSDAHSYLIFAWKEPLLMPEAGRWCLYEAIPDKAIDTERRHVLASKPYWDRPTHAEREAQAQLVSAFQWEMYRTLRVDVRPFWCVQGPDGGTPLHLDSIEKRFLRMMGQPDRAKAVGELAYAPWDARARTAVLERDRLVAMGRDVARLKATGTVEAVKSAREAAEKAFRAKFWDWMAEKLAPNADALGHLFKTGYTNHMRRETAAESIAAAEARDYFIEFGRVPDAVQFQR